jgi:vacuolar protein sorting-associated protein 35
MCKDHLPEDLNEALDFVLSNFVEANRLWVRLKFRRKQEEERLQLRIIVGTNLVRASQLEGLTAEIYRKKLLPQFCEQIVGCSDKIAQQYLMEVITQVFPDEFHVATLPLFLATCRKLVADVDIKAILTSLMQRMAAYTPTISQFPQVVEVFLKELGFYTSKIGHARSKAEEEPQDDDPQNMKDHYAIQEQQIAYAVLTPFDLLTCLEALMHLSIACDGRNLQMMDSVLAMCCDVLRQVDGGIRQVRKNTQLMRKIQSIIHIPLEKFSQLPDVLPLAQWPALRLFLNKIQQRRFAVDVLRHALNCSAQLNTTERVEAFFALIEPLLVDAPSAEMSRAEVEGQEKRSDSPSDQASSAVQSMGIDDDEQDIQDDQEFAEEQHLVARSVHLLDSLEGPEHLLKLLAGVRKVFGRGGKRRLVFTLPPLTYGYLKCATRFGAKIRSNAADGASLASSCQRLWKQFLDTVQALGAERPLHAVRLYLDAAAVCDALSSPSGSGEPAAGNEDTTYELISRAYLIYEEQIFDHKLQVHMLNIFTNTILKFKNLSEEQYESLATRVSLNSVRLLKKGDQCRCVCNASH